MKRVSFSYVAVGMLVALMGVSCSKKSTPTEPTPQQFTQTTLSSMNQIGIPQLRADFSTTGRFDLAVLALNYADNPYWLNTGNCRLQWYVPFKDGKGYTINIEAINQHVPTLNMIAVHMIMDGSGSLSTTDPTFQRRGAGKLFVSKLIRRNPNHLMAVAEFGRYAAPNFTYFLWKDFAPVSDSINFFHAFDALGCSLTTPMYTATRRSLEWTNQWVSAATHNRAVMLFTDGVDNDSDPGDDLTTVSALSVSLGIPVYVVGLAVNPADVDDVALTALAYNTGGIYAKATNAEQLRTIFGVMGAGMTSGYNIITATVTPIPPSGTAMNLISTAIDAADTTNKKSAISSYAIP